jgi:quinol monooxygenase YgiN
MAGSLLVVHVHVHVKPEAIEAFQAASLANAEGSRKEAGVLRFDVLQDRDDPARFVLVEIYRDAAAAAAHKNTAHYAAWRDAVADMMAEQRRSSKYVNVSPGDAGF